MPRLLPNINTLPSTLRGAIHIVPAMFIIGMIDNFIIFIIADSSVWQFNFIRSLLGCSLLLIYLKIMGIPLAPIRPLVVLIRSLLIAGSIILYFGSLALMPAAQAGAGLFSSPIFILGFSVIFFKTKIGFVRILTVLIGFIGVLLVLKPDINDFDIKAIFPLFAAVLYSCGQLITRHYCSKEETLILLFGFFSAIGLFGVIGTLLTTIIPIPNEVVELAPFFLMEWQPISGKLIFWTTIQAMGSLIAVAGLIRGYQVAEPTFVAIFEYSFLIFAGFWGWILWNHKPDFLTVLGICMVIFSGMVITIRSLPKTRNSN